MVTTRSREDAARIAADRSAGLDADDPNGWVVVEGPEDGDYTAMSRWEAEDADLMAVWP